MMVLVLNIDDFSRIHVTDTDIITAAHPDTNLISTHSRKNNVELDVYDTNLKY